MYTNTGSNIVLFLKTPASLLGFTCSFGVGRALLNVLEIRNLSCGKIPISSRKSVATAHKKPALLMNVGFEIPKGSLSCVCTWCCSVMPGQSEGEKLGQNNDVELHGVVIDSSSQKRDWQIGVCGVGRKLFICTTQLLVVPEGQTGVGSA